MKEVELCTIKTEKMLVEDRESVIRFNYRNNVEPVIPYDSGDVATAEYALIEHREYPIVAFYKTKQDLHGEKHNPFEPEIETTTYIALDDNCRHVVDLFTESLKVELSFTENQLEREKHKHRVCRKAFDSLMQSTSELDDLLNICRDSFWKRLKFLFTRELK